MAEAKKRGPVSVLGEVGGEQTREDVLIPVEVSKPFPGKRGDLLVAVRGIYLTVSRESGDMVMLNPDLFRKFQASYRGTDGSAGCGFASVVVVRKVTPRPDGSASSTVVDVKSGPIYDLAPRA